MTRPRTSPDAVHADRNRVGDLVRVVALGGVVIGHWLKQGWYVAEVGGLHRAGLLGIATWTHLTPWWFLVLAAFVTLAGFDRLLREPPAQRRLEPRISR